MTEQFILSYIPVRVKQLGYQNYLIRYRDLSIPPETIRIIEAYTDLYFIIDDPEGIIVESDYGIYDATEARTTENTHQHKGEISIRNDHFDTKRIKFIQVIIVN